MTYNYAHNAYMIFEEGLAPDAYYPSDLENPAMVYPRTSEHTTMDQRPQYPPWRRSGSFSSEDGHYPSENVASNFVEEDGRSGFRSPSPLGLPPGPSMPPWRYEPYNGTQTLDNLEREAKAVQQSSYAAHTFEPPSNSSLFRGNPTTNTQFSYPSPISVQSSLSQSSPPDFKKPYNVESPSQQATQRRALYKNQTLADHGPLPSLMNLLNSRSGTQPATLNGRQVSIRSPQAQQTGPSRHPLNIHGHIRGNPEISQLEKTQRYYYYLLSKFEDKNNAIPPSKEWALEPVTQTAVQEVFERVNNWILDSLPAYIRHSLPTYLLNIRTMRLVSPQSQEVCAIIAQGLHSTVKEQIDEMITVRNEEFGEKIYERLKKCISSKGWYSILSHRWGNSEITFEDIQNLSCFTPGAIELVISRCKANKDYFKGRSILSTLVTASKFDSFDSAIYTSNTSIISSLFRLVNSIDIDETNINSGFKKLVKFCHFSLEHHQCQLAWMDTCCINKSSSAELDESIRLMFKWYRNAEVCLIHLGSTSVKSELQNQRDQWFQRGWTLQELLAPRRIKFYDKDWSLFIPLEHRNDKEERTLPIRGHLPGHYSEGNINTGTNNTRLGVKASHSFSSLVSRPDQSLINQISSITGIPLHEIQHFKSGLKNVRERLKWASRRETARIEDQAYCLLGIFDITMPIAYGEGENAFYRLQATIMGESNDRNLFIWKGESSARSSMLARGPRCFSFPSSTLKKNSRPNSKAFDAFNFVPPAAHFTLTNHGLLIHLSLFTSKETDNWLERFRRHLHKRRELEKAVGLTLDTNHPSDGRVRLAILGYNEYDEPIVMLLTQREDHGEVYYKRICSLQPQHIPEVPLPLSPSHPSQIYIR